MKNFRINHFCYTFSSHVWIKTHSRLDNHCLFAGLETAALAAVVAAVLVQFYLYIGFLQLSALRKSELDVFYGQATVQPLLFVIGTDAENIIHQSGVVEVVGDELYGKPVLLYHVFGVGEHEVAVWDKINDTKADIQKVESTVQEAKAGIYKDISDAARGVTKSMM